MSFKWSIAVSLLGWLAAWAFWLLLTYRHHPTYTLALIVTTSLIAAFAAASYCNHLILVPRFLALDMRWAYVFWLAATMAVFTLLALFIIRISYHNLFGPDSDPYGAYKHFAIDFFGMTVHVAMAAMIVSSTRPLFRMSHPTTMQAEQSDAHKSPVGREFES